MSCQCGMVYGSTMYVSLQSQQTMWGLGGGYLCGVDLAIDDNPGATPELRPGWQVHHDWLAVGTQVLHYQRPSLHSPFDCNPTTNRPTMQVCLVHMGYHTGVAVTCLQQLLNTR